MGYILIIDGKGEEGITNVNYDTGEPSLSQEERKKKKGNVFHFHPIIMHMMS
jgi:hypothetical protein